jgi:Zn-dependent protease with chaperone function
MHLIMILFTLAIAWLLRLRANIDSTLGWSERWWRSLFFFLFSPLLLLMTAIAVICMGFRGEMLGIEASWLSYCLALGFAILAVLFWLKLAYQGCLSRQKIRTYTEQSVAGKTARIFTHDFPYSAQIGFWDSELVVSEGLLNTLDLEHLTAVLAHEQAHKYYRDTFWFFWLGWLRSFTCWLPQTESLWQELLLLREIRADRKAAETVEPLLLAESLLIMAQAPLRKVELVAAAFSGTTPRNRLVERIELLLENRELTRSTNWWSFSWLILSLIPLLTVPFHY